VSGMSDFEDRLAAVLNAEASQAPMAAELARGARRRHVRRRRRMIAVGAGAVAVVIAVPVLLTALGGDDEDRVATDPAPAPGWQTIEHHGVRVEVPASWGVNTCRDEPPSDIVLFSPDDGSCDATGYLSIYPAEESEEEGVVEHFEWDSDITGWGGYVEADEWGAGLSTADRATTLRILASVRIEGQPVVVADAWESVTADGVIYQAPLGWGVGPDDRAGYGVEVDADVSEEERLLGSEQLDERHYRLRRQLRDRVLIITAPTLAVAQLVAASAELESKPTLDPGGDLPCDPGLGDPQSPPGCPGAYATGEVVIDDDGEVVLDPVGGSPIRLDLSAVEVCSGAVLVGYREPLVDHVVPCSDFRLALEDGIPSIPAVMWEDGDRIVQLSELYHP
jgi:hypothetical protein